MAADVIEDRRENRADLGDFCARCATQHRIVGDGFDRLAQIFDAIAKHLKLRHVVREEIFRLELSHHFEEIALWKASRARRFQRESCLPMFLN